MRKSRIGIMAGLFALSLNACKDFAFSGDPLSEPEVSELAGAIVSRGFPGVGGVDAAPLAAAPSAGSAAAPAGKITISINDSGPCQGGGTVAIAGTLSADVNDQAHTGSLEYEYTLTPTGCVVTTQAGKTFTLTGDPNLKGEGKLDLSQTRITGSLKYSGKFGWTANDGRSGVCGVDLEAEFDLNSTGQGTGSAAASLSGSVCGVTVNRNVTIES